MRFVSLLAAAVLTIVSSPPSTVAMPPPPDGTISCAIFSDVNAAHPKGILFRPQIDANPRNLGIAVTNLGSSCDTAGVLGGKAPITGVAFKLTGRLRNGNCAALTSPIPAFENARLLVTWRGVNAAGKPMTVSRSRAHIAFASYDTDTHTLTFITEPLTGPAFVAKTLKVHLGFDYYADVFEAGCASSNGFVAQSFGTIVPSSIEVQ
ncbi:MAG: hypothetical protein ABIR79_16580 [Candidatus Binatia bacterium]